MLFRSCFLNNASPSPTSGINYLRVALNFTGNTEQDFNSGASYLFFGTGGGTTVTTRLFPDFTINQPYYLGLWKAGDGHGAVSFLQDQTVDPYIPGIYSWYPSSPATVNIPQPTIDTGGFFGPVIRALISIGVFILQNIINFSTFLYTLYIAALNILGSWVGLPNIGTNLDSFLRAFVQFMAQMATIIANLGSGITVLINDISFGATFIVGLLTSTASWLSAAVLLGGKLKQILDLIFIYGNNMLWIFFWSTFFLYTATGEGWSGTLEFFNAVNWASSLGANFVIRMVNFGVQAIAFLKGFIPTEAGAPPPTSPVSEGGKPSGASLQSTAKPVPAQPSRFRAGFSRANITRARGTTATKFKLSAARPAAPSFSAALEWDPIKVILILGGLLLLMIWIGGGLSPFGTASASCTVNGTPVSISVTASPFTYTNNDPWREGVTILGGNVSKVEVLGGGTTTVIFQHIVLQNDWTGAGASLEVGWSVRVTYYSAPTMTHSVQATAGNTAKCFQSSYDVLSQITAPILLMFASIGSITFLADKFGMIGSTFSGPATFRAVPRSHIRQRRELMKLRAREKQLRMEFRK